jgi:hypothetical protein
MAIKHEGEAVDEIMDFFYKNGVHIDDSRKRNLVSLVYVPDVIILFTALILKCSLYARGPGKSTYLLSAFRNVLSATSCCYLPQWLG